ncbi:MAG: dihydrodipicolinate synthase family protein [Monoglobaceae bacterium]
MKNINTGVYPTMITPYDKNGEIDYAAVKNLVEWYIENGCRGIFAVCQSSEMAYLTLEERVTLAYKVAEYAKGRISVVASGHCGHSIKEQIHEINEISKTGIDAFVLVSNRFDLQNEGDDNSISISDIATQCGFNSYSYFAECFKKYQGIKPSEYQKKNYCKASEQ